MKSINEIKEIFESNKMIDDNFITDLKTSLKIDNINIQKEDMVFFDREYWIDKISILDDKYKNEFLRDIKLIVGKYIDLLFDKRSIIDSDFSEDLRYLLILYSNKTYCNTYKMRFLLIYNT